MAILSVLYHSAFKVKNVSDESAGWCGNLGPAALRSSILWLGFSLPGGLVTVGDLWDVSSFGLLFCGWAFSTCIVSLLWSSV